MIGEMQRHTLIVCVKSVLTFSITQVKSNGRRKTPLNLCQTPLMIKMEMKEVKAQIKDYVRDHYKYYGWYPYDVQVGDVLYSYEQYMDILSMTV